LGKRSGRGVKEISKLCHPNTRGVPEAKGVVEEEKKSQNLSPKHQRGVRGKRSGRSGKEISKLCHPNTRGVRGAKGVVGEEKKSQNFGKQTPDECEGQKE
jgi:hypothetical protein